MLVFTVMDHDILFRQLLCHQEAGHGVVLFSSFEGKASKLYLPSFTFKGRERTIPSIRPAFRIVSRATLESLLKDEGCGD